MFEYHQKQEEDTYKQTAADNYFMRQRGKIRFVCTRYVRIHRIFNEISKCAQRNRGEPHVQRAECPVFINGTFRRENISDGFTREE